MVTRGDSGMKREAGAGLDPKPVLPPQL